MTYTVVLIPSAARLPIVFPHIAAMPRDMHYEREQTPTVGATLIPGDWLYVPRGWWHVARAYEDSLSISIGVLSPAAGGRR